MFEMLLGKFCILTSSDNWIDETLYRAILNYSSKIII